MTFGNLVPWNKRANQANREELSHPIYSMQKEMDRLFDGFFGEAEEEFAGLRLSPHSLFDTSCDLLKPRVDLSETDNEMTVSMELPGVNEEDIQVSLSDDVLTVSGEKKQETEENEKGWYRMERHYGSFKRSIPLPHPYDEEKADASFKDGVLTVKIPKTEIETKEVKQIQVNKG